jgi:hypothetical protein
MEVELSFRVQSLDVSRPSSMICGAPVATYYYLGG